MQKEHAPNPRTYHYIKEKMTDTPSQAEDTAEMLPASLQTNQNNEYKAVSP